MGGSEGSNTLATVEVYSPKTNSWRSCTPMSQRCVGAVAGVVGGRLVVAGGSWWVMVPLISRGHTGTGGPLPMPHAAFAHGVC